MRTGRQLGLEIRSGLHDARIAAEAGPGEILVSGTAKDLIAGSGIEFVDYSMVAPKGVPGERRVFAVDQTGMR